MTTSSFADSPAKRLLREQWNTPFLRYLHNNYQIRFRYMGFPGTDLIDVKLWRDMIEEVIAFELPYPGPDERKWIRQLRINLKKLDIPGIAYLGSFEEVVILRKDRDGQPYKQDKVITLYNLDFCDEIASLVDTLEFGKQLWRFEALRIILEDQKQCYLQARKPCHFIILLTVRNQIEASQIRTFLERSLLSETRAYYSTCEKAKPIPPNGPLIGTHAWSLKAFLYDILRGYFQAPNICTLFFPLVKYIGTPIRKSRRRLFTSPMLHWMLFCQFGVPENPTPDYYPQGFLYQVTSLAVAKSGITVTPEPGEIGDLNQVISPVDWFQPFESNFFTDGTTHA